MRFDPIKNDVRMLGESGEVEIDWTKDESMVRLTIFVEGRAHRITMSARQLDALRVFLNDRVE